ncbi:uncharacterized protein LOC121804242 [Salvia splendens]|uniref:uncharacterized protein LOC121804242 n=1 Tax=Salvia splendens TaxID=180675 RepID=UPI001C26D87F|nr:uncharacterized protein LOC121804242 [Salvia splendens]
MNEKEKEEVVLDHSAHVHPLILTKSASNSIYGCFGCEKYIFSGETIYRCRDECSNRTLHEGCAVMPAEITFSLHPQHTLVQRPKGVWSGYSCAICLELGTTAVAHATSRST